MKTRNIFLKSTIYALCTTSLFCALIFTSCNDEEAKVVEVVQNEVPEQKELTPALPEVPVVQKEEPAPVKVEPKVEKKPEPKKVEVKPEPTEEEKEYARSVATLSNAISQDAFQKDKENIMSIIDELSTIMKQKDYDKWLKYVSPASKTYWSNPTNLANVASRLPVKGLKLKSMRDYFLYVFIPARQNSKVDEIRYVSTDVVKVVEAKENEDIIYYLFEKSANGEWFLKLDTL